MDKLEMIEKLSQRAKVSYEDARNALEDSDWDMLDAFVLLEKQGKIKDAQSEDAYSTQTKKDYTWHEAKRPQGKVEVSSALEKLWSWLKKVVRKGNANQFVVIRKGEELISMPVTVMVILMICFWPVSLLILIAGLFLKARYFFRGPDVSDRVNDAIGAAQEKAASAVQIKKIRIDDDEKRD